MKPQAIRMEIGVKFPIVFCFSGEAQKYFELRYVACVSSLTARYVALY
jgi:hypothetical protein